MRSIVRRTAVVIATVALSLAAAATRTEAAGQTLGAPGIASTSDDWPAIASQRYGRSDFSGALDAWNHLGLPTVGAIVVSGADRTREAVVTAVLDLPQKTVLTRARWEAALKRLADLPAASASLAYAPVTNGETIVTVTIDEGTLLPAGFFGLGAVAGRAIVQRDLQVPLNNPTGHGEVLTTAFRWPSAWRRFLLDLTGPSFARLPGIADLQGSWERETYGWPDGAGGEQTVRESHTQIAFGLGGWVGSRAHWSGAASLDRWNVRSQAGATASLETRWRGDRLSVGADGGAWAGRAGGQRILRGDTWVGWRSDVRASVPRWTIVVEGASATEGAPFDLWSGAGSGPGRPFLLRAHPLISGDVIDGPVFGRTVLHATGEYQRPLATIFTTTLGMAGFVDAASAAHRVDGSASPTYVDVGLGLRWSAPGLGGVIRLDLARPLQNARGIVASAGWQGAWPRQ